MSVLFIIRDDRHCEYGSRGESFEVALATLRELSRIPWDREPNRAPCTSWRTCGRSYEIVQVEISDGRWSHVRHWVGLSLDAGGVRWSGELAGIVESASSGDEDT